MVFLPLVALVGLVWLVQLQAAVGGCGPLLPAVLASWDNPTTQVVDELASYSVPNADPAGPVREQVAQGGDIPARLVLPAEPEGLGRPGVDTGVTRSPPTV
jgi:hypothetical protein